jgi:AcrR family transcriptional regulator
MRQSSRETILDAAEAVTVECGAVHMTLDAVAEKAGVSKGGLLYHFPSKEALLLALVKRFVDRFNEKRLRMLEATAEGPMREAEAFVRGAFESGTDAERPRAAFLAAAANGIELLQPVKEYYEARFAEFAESDEAFPLCAVAALAADGLWMLELMQLSPLSADQRERVKAKLFELLDAAQ